MKLSFLIKPAKKGDRQTAKMKVKWTKLGMVFFLLLSFVMTGCFIWQYRLPKAKPGKMIQIKKAGHQTSVNEWQMYIYNQRCILLSQIAYLVLVFGCCWVLF